MKRLSRQSQRVTVFLGSAKLACWLLARRRSPAGSLIPGQG